MKLGQEKQDELERFLSVCFVDFWECKKLTPKKVFLIHEYTKYIQNKITGKTV